MSARLRTAHPYRDLDVIDARAPRFNQATVGVVSLVAVLTGCVAIAHPLGPAARARPALRSPILSGVRRLLRARAAALRRGADRGLPAAEVREPGRVPGPDVRYARSRAGLRDSRQRAGTAGCGARAAGRDDRLLRRLRDVSHRRTPEGHPTPGVRPDGAGRPRDVATCRRADGRVQPSALHRMPHRGVRACRRAACDTSASMSAIVRTWRANTASRWCRR